MTVRGLRGATTVVSDDAEAVLEATEKLAQELAAANGVAPEDIISVLVSTTQDIQSTFPAKAVRSIDGWKYVPVMCTHEMGVAGALPLCIRLLMHVNCEIPQKEIVHVYQNEAIQLRADLQK